MAEVERRLSQLEDVVASLCDTAALEKRIADQVASRLTQHEIFLPAVDKASPESASVSPSSPDAGQRAPSAAAIARPAPLATFAELPGSAPVPLWQRLFAGWLSPHSLLRELWWDLRIFWRMLRDPSYSTSLACKLAPPLILAYVFILPKLTPYVSWLVPSVQLGIFSILFDVVLLYVAFKIVHRELRRYHDYLTRFR
jgi:hypothetical protein